MIWDWLLSSMDASRVHDVGPALSWHARIMVFGWGVLAPVSVFVARFFKVLPWQNWPHELDSKVWWHSHWVTQLGVLVLSAVGLALILVSPQNSGEAWVHRVFGYAVLLLAAGQGLSGLLRGSKGGPTDLNEQGLPRGDHYDMTARRLVFEAYHRTYGYLAVALGGGAIISGLWIANAPKWMLMALALWWIVLAAVSFYLQRRGFAVDTYQAIWGPDSAHPGNRMERQGWGTVRPDMPLKMFDEQREK